MVVGIICEYNPLHLGHQHQLEAIRREFGPDTGIVCLMSGNYVQRGQPAIVDKSLRAQAAVCAGADLVLELPVTVSLSSAEGFAAGGVRILSPICDALCFGTESGTERNLMRTARALLSPGFSAYLRDALAEGLSFPAARQKALDQMGLSSGVLQKPNDILAVEYCKAILSQSSRLVPFPVHRPGGYHDMEADEENPSATAVRGLMLRSGLWLDYVPQAARDCFRDASFHTVAAGERAMLARLRTMTDQEFEALPYGSEGLWRKFMHACREQSSLEAVLTAAKSKRYTRTRLDRMAMCAFLGLTAQDLQQDQPYSRVLAFSRRGRQILKEHKQSCRLINIGERTEGPFWEREQRISDLYGLFSMDSPEAPGQEPNRRVYYQKEQETSDSC